MSYNHGKAQREFEKWWKEIEAEYKKAGMSEDDIKAMRSFEEKVFNANRRYEEHTESFLPPNFDEDEDDEEKLTREEFKISDDMSEDHSRYWWIEDIDDPVLAKSMKELPPIELEIITLYVFEGYSQEDIAKTLGITQQAVSKKFSKFRQILKSFKNRL